MKYFFLGENDDILKNNFLWEVVWINLLFKVLLKNILCQKIYKKMKTFFSTKIWPKYPLISSSINIKLTIKHDSSQFIL